MANSFKMLTATIATTLYIVIARGRKMHGYDNDVCIAGNITYKYIAIATFQ